MHIVDGRFAACHLRYYVHIATGPCFFVVAVAASPARHCAEKGEEQGCSEQRDSHRLDDRRLLFLYYFFFWHSRWQTRVSHCYMPRKIHEPHEHSSHMHPGHGRANPTFYFTIRSRYADVTYITFIVIIHIYANAIPFIDTRSHTHGANGGRSAK